jgi:inorganic pyrophosphatase
LGSRNKYEYEPDLGVIVRDRVLPGAVRYPTDYGFVPSTLTDRGDALDIVVAAYDPAFPGCVVRARPIGALHISDSKGEEHNVLAVPDDDPRFADIGALGTCPTRTCARSSSSSRSTSGWRATRKWRSLAGWTWMRRTS